MNLLWTHRDIHAPAGVLWELLTNPTHWPTWGPSVRSATIAGDAPLSLGATGTVTIVGGAELGFEITSFEAGSQWGWTVAGITATNHSVEGLGADRCRVGFGVPWPVAPYLGVCRVALKRLDRAATIEKAVT